MLYRRMLVAALAAGTSLGLAPTLATSASAEGAAPRVIVVRGNSAGFLSPTGNLSCSMGSDGKNGFVRCEALDHTWKLPRKPASCELDWGNGLVLDQRRTSFLCAGDTSRPTAALSDKEDTAWFRKSRDLTIRVDEGYGPMAALRYGYSLRVGTMMCTSTVQGITCRNLKTRHGFTMSKAAIRTW